MPPDASSESVTAARRIVYSSHDQERSMNKRFSWIFLLASGAFFVFIVGLTGYRIEDARRQNTATVREHAASLAAKVRSLRDITGSLQSPLFKTDMRDVLDGEPRL